MNKYESELVSRSCIHCGNNDFLTLSTRMRKGPQLTTVVCKRCSLVFSNPVPAQEVYYSFYANDYERYYGRSTASKPHSSAIPAIFSTLGKFLEMSSSDYLEIGPGRGLTLYHADKLFRSATGVEPSIDFARMLLQEYRLNVVHNTFEEFICTTKDKVDVVCMIHVLEHLYDPCMGLLRVRDILRENGLVVIEVPNILKPFRSLDSYFLRFVHLFNFSPTTLRCLLTNCGFTILYEDEGGQNWNEPQNITMIARKASFGERILPSEEEAFRVNQVLEAYRALYNQSLWLKWIVFDVTRKPLKYFRKIRHKLKVLLNG